MSISGNPYSDPAQVPGQPLCTHLFLYGPHLNEATREVGMNEPIEPRKAELPNHRIKYVIGSQVSGQSGAVAEEGKTVHGHLWKLCKDRLKMLEQDRSIGPGFERKHVEVIDSETREKMIAVAFLPMSDFVIRNPEDKSVVNVRPFLEDHTKLVDEYTKASLPETALKDLKAAYSSSKAPASWIQELDKQPKNSILEGKDLEYLEKIAGSLHTHVPRDPGDKLQSWKLRTVDLSDMGGRGLDSVSASAAEPMTKFHAYMCPHTQCKATNSSVTKMFATLDLQLED